MKLALYIQALPPAGQRMEPHQPQVFSGSQESGEASWPWLIWMGGKMMPLVPYKDIPSHLWVFSKSYIAFPCNVVLLHKFLPFLLVTVSLHRGQKVRERADGYGEVAYALQAEFAFLTYWDGGTHNQNGSFNITDKGKGDLWKTNRCLKLMFKYFNLWWLNLGLFDFVVVWRQHIFSRGLLNMQCTPCSYLFEHLVLSCWWCLEQVWKH